jgi:D-beta-D-heptose 7-phosphate kinase/D-beta-D-heptose 1-phosphate adenosyltransferase
LVEEENLKLGLAANVADNVQALGGTPLVVGVIGSDRGAQDFKKLLKKCRIDSKHLVIDGSRRTIFKERIVSDRQQLLRVDYETPGRIRAATEAKVLARIRALLPKVDAVVLEDYAKGLLSEEMTAKIFELARRAKKTVAVDPNSKTPLSWYRGASVLTPNTKEAEKLSGIEIRDDASLAAAGLKLLRATGGEHVVITRGKEGMAIFSKGAAKIQLIPTYAREVYDVSGAGDTVISVLALALAAGVSIEEACILGNLAAGVEVGKRGTATVSPREVEMALEFFGNLMA